jgi:hypothetical protein
MTWASLVQLQPPAHSSDGLVKLKGRAGPAVGRAPDRFLGMVFFFLSFLVKKKKILVQL